MKKFLVPLFLAAVTALFLASMTSAAPPNHYGLQCNQNSWKTVLGTTGPFASQSACVTYQNKGGVLYPKNLTATNLTATVSGPVQGLGALVGNPQSRVSSGSSFIDPAMLFTVGGTGWVPGPITLSYTTNYAGGSTAATVPDGYFPTAPVPTSSGPTGTFDTWFQDNCFDYNNVLVTSSFDYTLVATGSYGQTVTKTGTVNCAGIGATVLAGTGPAVGNGNVFINAHGWGFTPNTPLTMLYSVPAFLNGLNQDLTSVAPTTDANGSFTFGPWDGDNCIYDGVQQTTDQTFTLQVSDGTKTASVTGTLMCSLLQ